MSAIIELRQYTLKPGHRDALVALFEREFVESQEAAGMDLIGMFRDAADADRFVWLRGFPDMESRASSLAAFYGGPVWKAHREAANATMIDSDNVLLLRPAWKDSGFACQGMRAPPGAVALPHDLVIAAICHFDSPVTDAFVASFRDTMCPRCEAEGARIVAALVTESSTNTFPALPVREGENVFVWFSHFADTGSARILPLPPDLQRFLARPLEILQLRPTPRWRPLHSRDVCDR